MDSIEQRVLAHVSEQSGIEQVNVKLVDSLSKDLGLDSLDTIELTEALEDDFDIAISDHETEKLVTVQDVVNCVTSKV